VDEILHNFREEVERDPDSDVWDPCVMADNFMSDLHPEREIALWLHMSESYRKLVDSGTFPEDTYHEIFRLMLYRTFASSDEACLEAFPRKALTSHQALATLRALGFGPSKSRPDPLILAELGEA
jgi:hypothetical protein